MTVKSYHWLWKQIEKSIQDVEAQFSEESKQKHRFQLTYGDATKKVIKEQYVFLRDDLKMKCYTKKTGTEIRIDHHKIAACFCKAFIQKKVFTFTIDDHIEKNMLLSNYELAYNVSLRIIYLYLIEYYIKTKQEQYKNDLIQQKSLRVPETTPTHDRYHEGRIKTLALNDYYGIEFDLLTYSDMMYWIEYYNRQCIEGTLEVSTEDLLQVES